MVRRKTEAGHRIQSMRKVAKLTQAGLAERVGCVEHCVYKLEKGLTKDPHLSLIVKISQALNVPYVYLVEGYLQDGLIGTGERTKAEQVSGMSHLLGE